MVLRASRFRLFFLFAVQILDYVSTFYWINGMFVSFFDNQYTGCPSHMSAVTVTVCMHSLAWCAAKFIFMYRLTVNGAGGDWWIIVSTVFYPIPCFNEKSSKEYKNLCRNIILICFYLRWNYIYDVNEMIFLVYIFSFCLFCSVFWDLTDFT